MGCDCFHNPCKRYFFISTHTSRVGCDFFSHCYSFLNIFLLTHPVWDVTQLFYPFKRSFVISTHTSRVGCDIAINQIKKWYIFLLTHPVWDVTKIQNTNKIHETISTHTSRVGCDPERAGSMGDSGKFLLTHPVWDVTCTQFAHTYQLEISTHTSRVGCDESLFKPMICFLYFYSHIPCGMWPLFLSTLSINNSFLLTHPVWDVTLIFAIWQ